MAVWAIGGVDATCTNSNDDDGNRDGDDDGVNGGSSGIYNDGGGGGGGVTVGGSGSGSDVNVIPPSSSSSSCLLQLVHVFRVHDQGVNCVAANAGINQSYQSHYLYLSLNNPIPTLTLTPLYHITVPEP